MDKTSISKLIALVLRHNPGAVGITLDEHGWADVSQLITGIQKSGKQIDMPTLEDIVAADEKQRYSFNEDKTKIRANQGHSINVDVELKECEPPEQLFHGTGEKYVASIRKEGLIPKTRLYVHLSKDKETALKVGARHGKPHIFFVHSGKMYRAGYKFFLSENGVWLTKSVPPEYLEER